MKNALLTVLCGISIFLSGCSTLQKSDAAALQGAWSGREIGNAPETPREVIVQGNTFDYRGAHPDDWGKGTFTVREETEPKQLIVTLTECGMVQYVGKTSHMIYKVEDGTLKLSASEPGDAPAPTSFEGPGARHMVFKRK